MTEPYFKREAIDIPDLPGLIKQLLTDSDLNHLLYTLVPEGNIYTNYEATWLEYPGIYITEVSLVPDLEEENIPGGIGSTWSALVQLHIITSDDSYINYPPAAAGELDDESTKFNGAENVLRAIKQIVYRSIADNKRGYESDVLPTFIWDNAIFESGELVDGNYKGVKDVWSYIMTYTFECELVSRT